MELRIRYTYTVVVDRAGGPSDQSHQVGSCLDGAEYLHIARTVLLVIGMVVCLPTIHSLRRMAVQGSAGKS